jgi:hypothetical protein
MLVGVKRSDPAENTLWQMPEAVTARRQTA